MPEKPDNADLTVSLIVMSSQTGGTEQVVRQLAAGLSADGGNVDITTISPDNLTFLEKSGVPVRCEPQLTQTGSGYLRRLVKDLDVLRRYRGRTVNLHYPFCDLVRTHIMAMRLAGCRDIFVSFHHPQVFDPSRQASVKRALSSCRRLIVTTPQNEDFVVACGLALHDWISVALPGLEFAERYDRKESRQILGLPMDKFLVGSLARVAPEKRIHLAIEACAKLGMEAHFVLGGKGSDLDRVLGVAEQLLPTQHTILGELQDPSRFLASLDAFILLSDLEGFGLVFAEAASQGVASIACDKGGTATAIHDRVTGFLVSAENPVPSAQAHLESWMSDPGLCKEMGDAASNYVRRSFTLGRMTRRYAEIFRGNP